jgi:hypothetical protein
MSQDIDRLAELINSLLDFNKLKAGKMTVKRAQVQLADLIEHSCRASQAIAGRRKLVRPAAGAPAVYADRNLILQVIGNLLGNALKFTPEEGAVSFALRREGDLVACDIRDTGSGIPKDMLGRMFQKFEQAEHMFIERPKGTGLGLAICREIIELHGGTISVASEEGRGSTFTFTLPVYDPVRSLDRLFQDVRAAAPDGSVTLVLVDWTAAGVSGHASGSQDVQRFESALRQSIARTDHMAQLEPGLTAVVAPADPAGAEAMRARLQERSAAWWREYMKTSSVVGVRSAAAVCPEDGNDLAALMQAARRKLGGRWA